MRKLNCPIFSLLVSVFTVFAYSAPLTALELDGIEYPLKISPAEDIFIEFVVAHHPNYLPVVTLYYAVVSNGYSNFDDPESWKKETLNVYYTAFQ